MIRRAVKADADVIAQLAGKMWGENRLGELEAEFEMLLEDPDAAVFLCREQGRAIGFAQCQLRHDYVEGTSTSPVGYLEGVFVEAVYRKRGYGRLLVDACEWWAKEKGCAEFASDCEMDNRESLAFHLHSGFDEVNRIICFAKKL